jgi:hypothetical protein
MSYLPDDGHWRNLGARAYASSGDGAVVANMTDLMSWMRFMASTRDGTDLPGFRALADTSDRIAPSGAIYRLGSRLYRHAGYTAVGNESGMGAIFLHFPDLALSLAVFANGVGAWPAGAGRLQALAAAIVDAYLASATDPAGRTASFARESLAQPLAAAQLPLGALQEGTFVSSHTSEVLDVIRTGEWITVRLMGREITGWWRSGDEWIGADRWIQVLLRPGRRSGVGTLELVEAGGAAPRRFHQVHESDPTPATARALAGWYYSQTLRQFYRIGMDRDRPYLAVKDDLRPAARVPVTQLLPNMFRAGDLVLTVRRRSHSSVVDLRVGSALVHDLAMRRVAHE